MPTTPVGKIFKPQLRRQAIQEKIKNILRSIEALDNCRISFPDEQSQRCVVESSNPTRQKEIAQALKKLAIDVTLRIQP
ncbi:hypothetical protein D9M69_711860 [compost metagenome]